MLVRMSSGKLSRLGSCCDLWAWPGKGDLMLISGDRYVLGGQQLVHPAAKPNIRASEYYISVFACLLVGTAGVENCSFTSRYAFLTFVSPFLNPMQRSPYNQVCKDSLYF